MTDILKTQQILEDIEYLKKTLLSSGNKEGVHVETIDTHFILNILSLVVMGFLCMLETLSHVITLDLLASKDLPSLQSVGLFNTATFLVTMIVGYIAVIYTSAKKGKTSAHKFASDHFVYYKNFAICWDIFLKFCIFSMVVLAGKPEWIAGLLVIFTGDMIVHGRHFYLPLKQSAIAGALSFATGLALLVLGISDINAFFTTFIVINLWSLMNIIALRRKITKEQE